MLHCKTWKLKSYVENMSAGRCICLQGRLIMSQPLLEMNSIHGTMSSWQLNAFPSLAQPFFRLFGGACWIRIDWLSEIMRQVILQCQWVIMSHWLFECVAPHRILNAEPLSPFSMSSINVLYPSIGRETRSWVIPEIAVRSKGNCIGNKTSKSCNKVSRVYNMNRVCV